MKLKKREQWIAVVLLAVVTVPRFWSSLDAFVWDESLRLQGEISSAETVQRYQDKLIKAKRAQATVDRIVPRCLPDDESRATAMYQKWLYEAADSAGMHETIVTPETSETSKAGFMMTRARMQSTGPLHAVARFMEAVDERHPLQRILECRLTPRDKAAKTVFELSLRLEMLSSEDSELQHGPLPLAIDRSNSVEQAREMSLLSAMFHPYIPPSKPGPIPQPLVVRKATPPPVQRPQVRPPVPPPVALIGTVLRGSRHEAVFYDSRSKQASYVKEGEKLEYPGGFSAEVLGVGTKSVLLKLKTSAAKTSVVEMQLAQSLADLDSP